MGKTLAICMEGGTMKGGVRGILAEDCFEVRGARDETSPGA